MIISFIHQNVFNYQVQQFSGVSVIRAYSVSIFDTVFSETGNTTMFSEQETSDNVTLVTPGAGCQHTSSMAYIAAIVIGVCRLFSSLTLARILMTCSRRVMYFSSLVLTILSLLMFSTFSFMIRQRAQESVVTNSKMVPNTKYIFGFLKYVEY